MLFTYDGIVVGRREIGESNCFIDILTDEQGIIEATAHGVKLSLIHISEPTRP